MADFDYETDLQPCPMGCGRMTEDPAGGPCEVCWEDVLCPVRDEKKELDMKDKQSIGHGRHRD